MRAHLLRICALPFALGCTGEDSGGRQDSDSGAPASDGPCSPYSGIHGLGARWVYETDDGYGRAGMNTAEVTAYDAASGAVTMTTTIAFTDEDMQYSAESLTSIRCDDQGVWTTAATASYVVTTDDEVVTGTAVAAYDQPFLTLIQEMDVGATWTGTESVTITDSNYGALSYTNTIEYTVTREEDVQVAAGDYATLVLEAVTDGTTAESWLARDVGTVKATGIELVSYTP